MILRKIHLRLDQPFRIFLNNVAVRISIVCAFLLFIAGHVYAQGTGTIKGRVTDQAGTGLPQTTVTLTGSSLGVTTDAEGYFTIRNVAAGKHTAEVRFVGYITRKQTVVVKAGSTASLDIALEEDSKLLESVEVMGKTETREVRELAYNVTAIDTKKLLNTSSDLNQVLNRTTGVRVRETGGLGSGFSFSLNGFSGNQVKFFLDGVPMTNFGSSLTLNNIPVNMAERVEVYKGVVPVELGADALGGAVNIVTNQKIRNYIDASYSIGSFNTHRLSLNTRYTSANGFQIGANVFGNYSDNSYKIDFRVLDRPTGVYLPEQKYKHFHDGYRSGTVMLDAGVVDKKYADRLLVGLIVSGNKKEIQQGASMQTVVGEAYTTSEAIMPTLKYKKEGLFVPRLSASVYASYNITKNVSADTSSRVYDWTGGYSYRSYPTKLEGELANKTLYTYRERDAMSALNLRYDLNGKHVFSFNHTFSRYLRKEEDALDPTRGLSDPKIMRNTMGLSYKINLLENRLAATAFAKLFLLNMETPREDGLVKASHNQSGYGVAGAYFILPSLQVKTSYEDTYRLPESAELLGDGLNITANDTLKPEHSKNINLSLAFNHAKARHIFGAEAGFIYRQAKNFIRLTPNGPQSTYTNERSIRVTGFEGLIRYSYNDFIFFEINGTYQNIINTDKFDPPGSNTISYVYKKRLPNTPFLFGNAQLDFRFRNVWSDHDNLALNVGSNFVDAFYLRWPTQGDPKYKRDIPRQFTQSMGVTYSFHNGTYNIALDCRNITDRRVYDYFNIQKPGRSFSVKLRYFLNRSKV